ncbi:MAG: HAD hydrolase family protein, partial [Chloroflexi bacterium]|nr:HAD hydrolase family protein [Chloroflexota bacterium]
MHLRILACDLDGTLTETDQLAPETWAMLRQAKAAGLHIILVTGRRLEMFDAKGLFAELCEAIVAEDGAVVYFPRRDSVVLPFGQLAPTLLQRLQQLGLPFAYGMALVATQVPHDGPIWEILRELGGGATVEYNRGSVMVLPSGATKGAGLQYALQELGYSAHNVVACGDAENDRSLFEVAELAMAVANAAPEIQALADLTAPYRSAMGVRWLLDQLLVGQIPAHRLRPERRLYLGVDLNDTPVYLDPCQLLSGNWGLFGASASGKSWIAGLLAEQLLRHGYQVCIIDPEGDYRGLHAFPHTLLLGGHETQLPPVADVITLSEYGKVSLVLDLSLCTVDERKRYVAELLRAMRGLRQHGGQPHWLLLDEVHCLCPPGGGALNQLCLEFMQVGGCTVVSYRSDQVDPALLAQLDHWLLTRMQWSEERPILGQYLPGDPEKNALLQTLSTLPQGQAYLINAPSQRLALAESITTFRVGSRAIPHIRHLHKYLQAPLPAAKQFYFCDAAGRLIGKTAASLLE